MLSETFCTSDVFLNNFKLFVPRVTFWECRLFVLLSMCLDAPMQGLESVMVRLWVKGNLGLKCNFHATELFLDKSVFSNTESYQDVSLKQERNYSNSGIILVMTLYACLILVWLVATRKSIHKSVGWNVFYSLLGRLSETEIFSKLILLLGAWCWILMTIFAKVVSLQWRHNEHNGVSNHQPHDCLLNRLLRRRSKKISKLSVTGLCVGNSPVAGEFPAQRASSAGNVSIWWRQHV